MRNDKKEQFIILRAEGLSYGKIAQRLKISKSTCYKWCQAFSKQIEAEKEKQTAALYELYKTEKEAYLLRIRKTLKEIDKAIEGKDFAEIQADKLLRLKLEYEDRLQAALTEPAARQSFKEYTTEELLKAIADLYNRIRSGSVSPEQARSELAALDTIRKGIADSFEGW